MLSHVYNVLFDCVIYFISHTKPADINLFESENYVVLLRNVKDN